MKHKTILTAVLYAIALLAGCGESIGDSVESQSVTVDVSNVEISSTTVESKPNESSQSSTSSTVSTPPKVEPKVPKATFNQNAITVDSENMTMTAPFTTDIPFESGVQYNLRIYFSDSANGNYELRYDEPFDTNRKSLTLKLHNWNNYYYIQFYSDKKQGEKSNTIYQEFKPVIKHKKFEFFTMSEGMYGHKTLYGYPNYDEVDYLLAKGITPQYISVDVYFKCDLCGTKTYCDTVDYSYNEGELQFIENIHCETRGCRNRTDDSKMLFSHIVD